MAITEGLVQTILHAIEGLVPGAELSFRILDQTTHSPTTGITKSRGIHRKVHEVDVWTPISATQLVFITAKRADPPLSNSERELLGHIVPALRGLDEVGDRALQTTLKVYVNESVDQLIIAHYLRGNWKSTTFWTTYSLLSDLRSLSGEKYEGRPCTSGIIYSRAPLKLLNYLRKRTQFQVEELSQPIEIEPNFLLRTSAHRYVDGKNAFYIIDNHRQLVATVRLTSPGHFSSAGRAIHEHLRGLLETNTGRMWIGYTDENGEVTVMRSPDVSLRWSKGRWQMADVGLLRKAMDTLHMDHESRDALVANLVLCSRLRRGALVLVQDPSESAPGVVGTIDNSVLGTALKSAAMQLSLTEHSSRASLVGILTSDGLTRVAANGELVGLGEILDTSNATGLGHGGGGRTQAAAAASTKGLALKVSEDGPVSVYRHGVRLLTMLP